MRWVFGNWWQWYSRFCAWSRLHFPILQQTLRNVLTYISGRKLMEIFLMGVYFWRLKFNSLETTAEVPPTKFSMGKWAWWSDQRSDLGGENVSWTEKSSFSSVFVDCVKSQRHIMTLTKSKRACSEAGGFAEPLLIGLENRKLECLSYFSPT